MIGKGGAGYVHLGVIGAINGACSGMRPLMDASELRWKERAIEVAANVDRIDESTESRLWDDAKSVPALASRITCSRVARLLVVLGRL